MRGIKPLELPEARDVALELPDDLCFLFFVGAQVVLVPCDQGFGLLDLGGQFRADIGCVRVRIVRLEPGGLPPHGFQLATLTG